MRSLLAFLLLVAALAAGCGGARAAGGGETASLWVTRDRGAHVLFEGRVPAGLTVMQALRRERDVETRYGGRFVQSIDGLGGSLSSGRDWFYFVNGIAADRGAAEYRLRPGEIAWWDLRTWRGRPDVQVVVGAFPEPFVHGYDGKVRPAHVRYERPAQAAAARAIGRRIGAASVRPADARTPRDANLFLLRAGAPHFRATLREPGGPVVFSFAGDAMRLARAPAAARFRFEGMS